MVVCAGMGTSIDIVASSMISPSSRSSWWDLVCCVSPFVFDVFFVSLSRDLDRDRFEEEVFVATVADWSCRGLFRGASLSSLDSFLSPFATLVKLVERCMPPSSCVLD